MNYPIEGYVEIIGRQQDLFLFVRQHFQTNKGAFIEATLQNTKIIVPRKIKKEKLRVKNISTAFLRVDDDCNILFPTYTSDIYSMHFWFQEWEEGIESITQLCKNGNVSFQMNVTDFNNKLHQYIWISPKGEIVAHKKSVITTTKQARNLQHFFQYNHFRFAEMNSLYVIDFSLL